MIDSLLQIGLSNAFVAGSLAIFAFVVGAKFKRPHLSHALWLLVFVKLLTPPIVNIPVEWLADFSNPFSSIVITDSAAVNGLSSPEMAGDVATEVKQRSTKLSMLGSTWIQAKPWITSIWIAGMISFFVRSLLQAWRFNQLLIRTSKPASKKVFQIARCLCQKLELGKIPDIRVTSAQVSPMVWWMGGDVRIILPQYILNQMSENQWRLILAHELAHVRRRDHMVRWLEWLACNCFWWNPVVWWAQKNLRASEEICCDSLVLANLNPGSHAYANSILTAVESLVRPVLRPPAMASEINSGGYLERRFQMIMSGTINSNNSQFLRLAVFAFAIFVIPFGLVQAQDYDKVQKGLSKMVNKGQLSETQAEAMLTALRNASPSDPMATQKVANTSDEVLLAGQEIREAISAGKISKEEGRARMATLKKSFQQSAPRDNSMQALEMRIREAVAAGKLSAEEGRAKMEAVRKNMESKTDKAGALWAAALRQIEAAVESGELSQEDASKKTKGIHRQMELLHTKLAHKEAQLAARREFELALKAKLAEFDSDEVKNPYKLKLHMEQLKLLEAVAAGTMTKEEAHEKMQGMKDQIHEHAMKALEHVHELHKHDGKDHDSDGDHDHDHDVDENNDHDQGDDHDHDDH